MILMSSRSMTQITNTGWDVYSQTRSQPVSRIWCTMASSCRLQHSIDGASFHWI